MYPSTIVNPSIKKERKTQYVHAILDRSASMMGKVPDAICGFKESIHGIKKDKEESFDIYVSAKMFDHEEEELFTLKELKTISDEFIDNVMKKYIPRGKTSIRDALGTSLVYFFEKYKTEKFDTCVIYVFTDGIENASTKFSEQDIKKMIFDCEERNIKVVYVGANQDSLTSASNIGISPDLALNYTETTDNVVGAYRALSGIVSRAQSGGQIGFTLPERSASYTQATVASHGTSLFLPPVVRRF